MDCKSSLTTRKCHSCSVTKEKALSALARKEAEHPGWKVHLTRITILDPETQNQLPHWGKKIAVLCIFFFCRKWIQSCKKILSSKGKKNPTKNNQVNPISYLCDGSLWLTAMYETHILQGAAIERKKGVCGSLHLASMLFPISTLQLRCTLLSVVRKKSSSVPGNYSSLLSGTAYQKNGQVWTTSFSLFCI